MITLSAVLATTGDASPWTVIAGRLHPALVQLPTGLLAALVALELWGLVRKRPLEKATRRLLAALVAVTLVLAALTGWELSSAERHNPDGLRLHLVGGAVFAVMGVVLLGSTLVNWRSAYLKALVVTVLLALPVGWMGGELTHGAGFPLQPSAESEAAGDLHRGEPSSTTAGVPAIGSPASAPTVDGEDPTAVDQRRAPVHVTPDVAAVTALLSVQAHVETLDPTSGLLWVDMGALAAASDEQLAQLLRPLTGAVADLSLARSSADAASVAQVVAMPHLERLDLSRSAVTPAAVASLVEAPRLTRVNLTGTAVDDDALEALAELASLQQLFVFDTDVTAGGVTRFVSRRPDVQLVADTVPTAAVLEVESPPVLLSLPEADLAPVNATCPVSGGAVDPRFLLVHDGRVLGFCCAECPSTFWADPAAFPVTE